MIFTGRSGKQRIYSILLTLTFVAALMTTGCAKFNTILGSGATGGKIDGTVDLFVPEDGNDTQVDSGDNGFNGDYVIPPGGGGTGLGADTSGTVDSGGGRRL